MDWFFNTVSWVVNAFWAVVGFMSPEEWAATGAIATLVVAVSAALYARGAVREARNLREEQARPYVAVYLELAGQSTLDLVVKNFGATTARDVTLESDKPLKRYWSGAEEEDLLTFESMPVLVPGQDWRTLFDAAGERADANNQDVYTIKVRSKDSRGRRLPDEVYVLDWRAFKDTQYLGVKTIDDIGKAVEGINKTLAMWSEGSKGLAVVSRDGDARDAKWIADRPARQARRETAMKILRPNGPSGLTPPPVEPEENDAQAE